MTQAQYHQLLGLPAPQGEFARFPMTDISYEDANHFCSILSDDPIEKSEGRSYRLPTEAEWEHACRAGTRTVFFSGDSLDSLSAFAWTIENSNREPHPVGQKRPNAWGLYDMHGNVWEMCSDWASEYPVGDLANPTGPPTGRYRVIRGGGFYDQAYKAGSSVRGTYDPKLGYDWIGFRLVMELRPEARLPSSDR